MELRNLQKLSLEELATLKQLLSKIECFELAAYVRIEEKDRGKGFSGIASGGLLGCDISNALNRIPRSNPEVIPPLHKLKEYMRTNIPEELQKLEKAVYEALKEFCRNTGVAIDEIKVVKSEGQNGAFTGEPKPQYTMETKFKSFL